MTWRVGANNPLFLFPNLAAMPFNWSHETAWAGNDWNAESGTPSRDSTHSLFGSYGGKYTGSTDQGALARFSYDANIWGAVNAGPYSIYAWIYPTAYTGAAAVRMSLYLTKAAGVALTTPSQTIVDYPISGMALNAWNLVRCVAPKLGASQQSEFVSVDYRIYTVANGGTFTLWADGCHFGYAFDFQDLGPNPAGAFIAKRLKMNKVYSAFIQDTDGGAVEGDVRNDGLKETGPFTTTLLDEGAQADWDAFYARVRGRKAFSFWRNQNATDRDYILKSILDQSDNGYQRQEGQRKAAIEMRLREVA